MLPDPYLRFRDEFIALDPERYPAGSLLANLNTRDLNRANCGSSAAAGAVL